MAATGKLLKEQEKLYEKYPETDAYKALIANRDRDRARDGILSIDAGTSKKNRSRSGSATSQTSQTSQGSESSKETAEATVFPTLGEGEEDTFGDTLRSPLCRHSINRFTFVINNEVPLICTTLGHALADAEPMFIIRKLLECGADAAVVQYENDETPLSAEQMLTQLKKAFTKERAELIAEMTGGNVLDKNYCKNALKVLKEFAKEASAFKEGVKAG